MNLTEANTDNSTWSPLKPFGGTGPSGRLGEPIHWQRMATQFMVSGCREARSITGCPETLAERGRIASR